MVLSWLLLALVQRFVGGGAPEIASRSVAPGQAWKNGGEEQVLRHKGMGWFS